MWWTWPRGMWPRCAFAAEHTGCEIINLGTGVGYSVLDIVHTFSRVNHVDVPYVIAAPPGRGHRRLLCRPLQGQASAALAGGKDPRGYVPGQLALADSEPQRLSGLNTAPRRAHAFRGIFCPTRRLQQDLTARGNFLFHKNML